MAKQSNSKKDNLIPLKKDAPKLEKQSLQSIDGFNLAEFSLSPLSYQTKDLAHQQLSFEWEQNIGDDKNKHCFFKLSYGETPPNADTEDYLLLLLHLAQKKGNHLSVETSFYEIMKTKGLDYKPGKQYTEAIVRHLDALMDLKIETNFIYDRTTGKWNKGIKTRVITSYEYKTKEYSRTRLIHSKDGRSPKRIDEEIHELGKINFDPTFYKHFVKDAISFDLSTYFSLENPTPKRLYRFGNKYVNNLGTFGIDLVHFCITRLGMKRSYVESFSYVSKLSAKLKPHIKRVNETVDNIEISISKSKGEPSGYKISFNKSESIELPTGKDSFTKTEQKYYQILIENGIYPTPARKLIVKLRTHLGKGKRGGVYIEFTIRKFGLYQKRTTINLATSKRGAILLKAFQENWYFPEFMEWHNKKKKKEEKEEIERYGNLFEKIEAPKTVSNSVKTSKPAPKNILKQLFDFKTFVNDYNKLYSDIYAAQKKTIEAAVEEYGMDFVTASKKMTIEQVIIKRVKFYCEECFNEWQKGNPNYVPKMIIDIQN
jgi:hypothetical protein